jgi:hypothetical protein
VLVWGELPEDAAALLRVPGLYCGGSRRIPLGTRERPGLAWFIAPWPLDEWGGILICHDRHKPAYQMP